MAINKKETYKTICSYCGVGCGIRIHKDTRGKLELEGDPDYPVNKGMLCAKGMNLHYTVQDQSDRLRYPQMRWGKNHPLQRVNWDTALTRAAAVFKSLIQQYGPDAVGFYVSGQCLTEEYYLANKLVKGFLGTNNIDTNSRLCMSSAVVGYVKTLGEDSVPISYDDIELADCFFITGANPAWCHPILFRRIEQHKEKNPGTKLIVVDPRVTQTATVADLHLQIRPGSDTVLYQGIGRCLIEQGDIDLSFIKKRTNGFEAYKQEVMQRSLAEVAQTCDVPETDIRKAAQMIGDAKGFLTMWAMGLNQSSEGVNKNLSLLALNLITGHIGKPGSGPFSLTGQPNAMGGREVGGMANLLAAHRDQQNSEHRKEVAQFWQVDHLPDKPGLTAVDMFKALKEDKMKAVWIICTNPSVSLPNARLMDEAMKKARFVVVQDISNRSDTLAYADLVLPAAGWLEKEGTMTNSERRISHLAKVIEAPGEALPDWEILCRFAQKMGFNGFDFASPAEVYAEHCALTKGTNIDISGLNYKRLQREGSFQWPVPTQSHLGSTRLFTDHQFYTHNKKAQIFPSGAFNETEKTTEDLPLILTTGRIRDQWHTMTKTGKVNKLNKHIELPFLEMHPEDASSRNLKNNDLAVISNARGEVRTRVQITQKIKKGVVFLPMHWGKTLRSDFRRANNLTDGKYDPISKEPGYKFSAVQVARYKKAKQKLILVGAGAATYRFINTYRELNEVDEIQVFSKEEHPFYNRVLLPEYVNEHLDWSALLKFKNNEFEQLNIDLHQATSIEKIDRVDKIVVDSNGNTHCYDKLILATGSRAFLPPGVPVHLPGIFTLRSRKNADELKQYLQGKKQVVIVGGGLLGLELAGALRETNLEVTVVQLASRLMQRQLDPLASKLLLEIVEDMGIQVFLNDEVQDITTQENTNELIAHLKSGKPIHCEALVYAIGTRPNVELAKAVDIQCGKGVLVNDYLQTNAPDIFAIGEIAEHRQKLSGITAAAEAQANVLAHYLSGDLGSIYQGTIPMNILKLAQIDLCTLGIAEIPNNAKGYEEIILLDQSKHYYKKCIVYQDKLVGAILMGDKSEFAEFKSLIEEGTELSEKRMELLRSGGNLAPMIGELLCACGNVGVGNIQQAIENNGPNLHAVCRQTGAGLGCGTCKSEVKNLVENYKL